MYINSVPNLLRHETSGYPTNHEMIIGHIQVKRIGGGSLCNQYIKWHGSKALSVPHSKV